MTVRAVRQSSIARLLLGALGLVTLVGCSGASDTSPSGGEGDGGSPERPLTGELAIAAAASLTAAFDELSTRFEARHPGLDVMPVRYDGSSTLATQIIEGAPVDVFAAADEATMARVVDAGLARDPDVFATNVLVIVVPSGNPGGVETLTDLADPELAVVLCAPEVPCGAASETLLARAGVTASVDSAEQSVTAVLAKVQAGEADAGLVYATDARSADGVAALVPEGADDVVNRYQIAALDEAANPEAAAEFLAFVRGEEGRSVLDELGFGMP